MCSKVLNLLVLTGAYFLAVGGQSGYFVNPIRKADNDEGAYGGTNGGEYFNDYYNEGGYLNTDFVGVRSIIVSYSDQVESIQVTYLLANKSLYQAPRHGSVKGINPPVEITLVSGEYIQKIEGKTSGTLIDQLTITTHRPKQHAITIYGPFGTGGKTDFSSEGYVVGFFGSSGDMLNSIGVYHIHPAKRSDVFGKGYKSEKPPDFSDNPDRYFPPVVKIRRLSIYHGSKVNSIQAQYQLWGGARRLGIKIGGDGGDLTMIKFEDNEEILGVEGSYVTGTLCQLTLLSRRYNLSQPVLYNGPFGWPCLWEKPTSFSVSGNILGFFGNSNDVVTALGVYFV